MWESYCRRFKNQPVVIPTWRHGDRHVLEKKKTHLDDHTQTKGKEIVGVSTQLNKIVCLDVKDT